jgi:hypothetical protein
MTGKKILALLAGVTLAAGIVVSADAAKKKCGPLCSSSINECKGSLGTCDGLAGKEKKDCKKALNKGKKACKKNIIKACKAAVDKPETCSPSAAFLD